jgi:hypothetical protein
MSAPLCKCGNPREKSRLPFKTKNGYRSDCAQCCDDRYHGWELEARDGNQKVSIVCRRGTWMATISGEGFYGHHLYADSREALDLDLIDIGFAPSYWQTGYATHCSECYFGVFE